MGYKTEKDRVFVHLPLQKSVAEQLSEIAKQRKMSRAKLITRVLERFVEQHG